MTDDTSLRSARICAGVSAALLAAVLIVGGIRSASEEGGARADIEPTDGISAFTVDRAAVRADELSQLEAIAADPASSDGVRASAQERIMQLMEWMELEATITDVLTARGYDAPVVTVHSESVNVVVRAETLTQAEAEIILELTSRETGVSGGNVKIIPIK